MKPCVCCNEKKTPPKEPSIVRAYNRNRGKTAKWVRANGERKAEYTIRTIGGKKFSGNNDLAQKCGDGTFGFATRRRGDGAKMVVGLDGQLKKSKTTNITSRSARATASRHARQIWGILCGLWSDSRLLEVQQDPLIVAEKKRVSKKVTRREKRNYAARKGLRKGKSNG